MKKTLASTLVLLLLTACLANVALAAETSTAPAKSAPAHQMQAQDISPEKLDKSMEIRDEYMDKSAPLLNSLWAKNQELDALARNPKTEPSAISKLTEDMRVLREQLYTMHKEMLNKMQKDLGLSKSQLRCMPGGMHMMGGMGMMDGKHGMDGMDGDGRHGMGGMDGKRGMGKHGMGMMGGGACGK